MTFVKFTFFAVVAAMTTAFIVGCIMLTTAANQYADSHVIVIP